MADALETDTTEFEPREQRINLAIFDYHARVDRGEKFDPRHWLEEHAEIASQTVCWTTSDGSMRPLKSTGI